MKKFFTLLLVLAGCVSTVSATKTIYVKNNCSWPQIRVHQWNGANVKDYYLFISSDVYVNTITDGVDTYFEVTLDDDNYTNFIIHKNYSGGDERKTVNYSMSDVKNGALYHFEYKDKNGDGSETYTLSFEKYYYHFSVNTENFTSLKIYLFYSSSPINGEWGSAPAMTKTDNIFTYNFFTTTSYASSIGVIFYNDNGQTEDLTAVTCDNKYILKYVSTAEKKLRKAEVATTNASGYCTFVNTNPLTIPEGTAYYATDNGNGSATAKQITNPEASTPMIIKGTPSTSLYFEVAATGESATGNAFHAGPVTGLVSNPSTGIYNYILNGDTFYAANGKNVGENKAYLQLSKPAASRVLIFEGEDETTGINTVENTQSTIENTAVYNLNGQRIVKPTKGLYIQNGKKYIVK